MGLLAGLLPLALPALASGFHEGYVGAAVGEEETAHGWRGRRSGRGRVHFTGADQRLPDSSWHWHEVYADCHNGGDVVRITGQCNEGGSWLAAFSGALLGLIVGLAPLLPAMATVQESPLNYGYEDTTSWVKTYPECRANEQSPIIVSSAMVSEDGQEDLQGRIHYSPTSGADAVIFNNAGRSIQAQSEPGKLGELILPDGPYEVKQFHFHFPAEHVVDDRHYAGELHIVHQKVGSKATDDLAVVAIMLDLEQSSQPDQQELAFLRNIGFGAGGTLPERRQSHMAQRPLDLNAFSRQLEGGFYHYTGSLTTPPCSEKVHWYVFKRPAPVSKDMVDAHARRVGSNNRSVQELNKRTVLSNTVAVDGEFVKMA
eukprot:TRINITY_DN20043_c0_g1_i3.p1 TRINITY_DN20043_c0_g1~~TRINITY_DN20043_c0_g1_i3.p1  ORF type:complete len:371 (+),score=69.25 TRINITY_DN20043_c0_g1_i3:58-1170(+)